MPHLTKVKAQDIAAKLKRKSAQKPNRHQFTIEEREGRDHTLVVIFYGAVRIGQYGIQRGKKGQGHDYIPAQILLNSRQAYDLAKCPFSVDDRHR